MNYLSMKNYKIECVEYIDEKGKVGKASFEIYHEVEVNAFEQFMQALVFNPAVNGKIKVYEYHEDCGWGDCHDVKTTFNTLREAERFIKVILCKGVKTQVHRKTEVSTISCSE